MLVSISLDDDATVEAASISPLADESLIRAVPSARQNASVSSDSIRLHRGQRFMLVASSPSIHAWMFQIFNRSETASVAPVVAAGKDGQEFNAGNS